MFSPRNAPELCFNFSPLEEQRARGMPGAQCTRSLVRAGELSMRTSIHSGGTGYIRHSPRNGFNGFLRALPGDEFLFATVTARIEWHLISRLG